MLAGFWPTWNECILEIVGEKGDGGGSFEVIIELMNGKWRFKLCL
jgi:hypothetical protein